MSDEDEDSEEGPVDRRVRPRGSERPTSLLLDDAVGGLLAFLNLALGSLLALRGLLLGRGQDLDGRVKQRLQRVLFSVKEETVSSASASLKGKSRESGGEGEDGPGCRR